ncbi:MAG: RimK family alpha-L-glutamate ligase, partial [bacterium]
GLYCRNQTLDDCHALLVRTIPGGSLEQIIFRMDALHCLEKRGVYLFNPPKVVERTVDKYYTTSLLATAGLPTPPTVVTENYSEAMAAFAELGEDVVVKPLFGSLGRGMVRVTDPDTAHRVFRALDLGRYVYYLQQFVPHDNQDLRVFVLGGRVVGAMLRRGDSWKTNIALGARPQAVTLRPEEEELALEAARVLGAAYAGVDLLRSREGELYVLEVNGIPGWQGLQEVCEVDVAGEIADYVLKELAGRR